MITLSKLNGKQLLVNCDQIEYIESIPESKIVMMNGEYLLVREGIDVIIDKVIEYRRRCFSADKDVTRQRLCSEEHEQN